MKVYLVGGAVRDQLLGLTVTERDWVVVGATPEELLNRQFRKVGRDFPVFLHPKTHEEYALARTERKSAAGYYGFSCDFNPKVTLLEDLARRDLTINAMAMDEHGVLIDPYGGQEDLKKRLLRHVSPAFCEDPVRVLRVARFAARFHHLGFRLANETRVLMYSMVKAKELAHLVPERVWQEWSRSLEEKNPEQFILTLRACDALRVILPEIHALFGVPNPRMHHPEVDSGIHTLMSLSAAAQITQDPVIRFSVLVHDLGKACSPMLQWPKHHGHEAGGVAIIESMCSRLHVPNEFRTLSKMVSRFHLNIHRVASLRPETILSILEQCDAFRRPELFQKMLLACQADVQGRNQEVKYPQAHLWGKILSECMKVNTTALIAEGLRGAQIKEALHKLRTECVKKLVKSWGINEK